MPTVKLTLTDGKVLDIVTPGAGATAAFLNAAPAFDRLSGVMDAIRQRNAGVRVPIPEWDDEVAADINPLLAKMSGLSVAEVTVLAVWDWIALVMAIHELLPKDFLASKTESASAPTPAESVTSSPTGPADSE